MTLSHFLTRILNIVELYIRKSPAGLLIGAGVALMTAGPWLAGTLLFRKVFDDGSYLTGEISANNTDWWTNATCLSVGIVLILIGIYFAFVTFNEQRRKSVVAIELRGLSMTVDTPLTDAIPSLAMGRRESILIDIRQLVEGTTTQKKGAVQAVNLIPERLKQYKEGKNRDDLNVYAGGLAPVPLLFLAGNLLASESKIHWFDWNRKSSKWVSPASGTDLPACLPMNSEPLQEEVILAFSVSYPINLSEITIAFRGVLIVELKLENPKPGLVVSEASIQELMQDFMSTVVALKAKGVKKIHLILAAPSILSMRLGTSYAKRNMPELIVYQYQQAQKENPYPWGVRMPNSETNSGELVSR